MNHIKYQKSQKRIRFLNDQINEMHKHRWIMSQKAGYDLGEAAFLDWILKYAAIFRDHWELENGKVEEDNGSDN